MSRVTLSSLIWIFYIFLVLNESLVKTDEGNCSTIEDESDRCGLKLAFIGDREALIPSDEPEMEQHCKYMYDNYFCLRRYVRNCMKSFSKSLFRNYLWDVRSALKQRCSSQIGRQEFIKHASCLKNASKDRLESIHQCKDNYVAQLEWVMSHVKSEDQLIAGCCAYTQTQACLKEKTDDVCAPAEETTRYLDAMVHRTTTQAINYLCTKYKNITQCRLDLDEATWTQLYEIGVNQRDPANHHKSTVMVTVDLLSSAKQ